MRRRHFLAASLAAPLPLPAAPGTEIAIDGDRFLIDGKPTYPGRTFRRMKVEGLLMNSRMVQGIFDDLNPQTRARWVYPDTGRWDPERNTNEFLAAMPDWRRQGLLSFTINLQGGSPEGYSKGQPWENTAFDPEGGLRAPYMGRLGRILDRARDLGMAPMVGYFYFGQDQRLKDEAAVRRGVGNATGWLLDRGYRHLLIEIANETTNGYHHAILRPDRIPELIEMVKGARRQGFRFLAGTSMTGGAIPTPDIVRSSDFLLLHGNGVGSPDGIAAMVARTRQVAGYRPMPILFNEDDHFDFDKPANNMLAALGSYASWGYFDPGASDYSDGYQCPPVNWGINTARKQAFFRLLREVTV